jgi:hypothetical protein
LPVGLLLVTSASSCRVETMLTLSQSGQADTKERARCEAD